MDAISDRLAKLTFSHRLRIRLQLGWGKLRRQYLIFFRPGYIRKSLERRRGQCGRSGACCRLMYTCAFFQVKDQAGGCGIYKLRPRVCRNFPIDERDLADRDLLMPDHPCGFSFAPEGAAEPAKNGYLDLTQYHSQGLDKEVSTHAE